MAGLLRVIKILRALSAVLLAGALASAARAEITVVDDTGREVILPAPARRIVALAPHIVESAFAAGAGDYLVAAVDYSNYPAAARELPRVGNYNSFSIEEVLRLKPDLVLAWRSGNGDALLERLYSLGLTVYVSEPRELGDIGREMERIGRLTGREEAAGLRADFDARLAALRRRFQSRPPVTVFYQIWNEPLQTVNGEHIISDVIGLCGGRNIFASERGLAPRVGVESVLRLDPQVIIASGMAGERPEWLDEWQRWPALQAVAKGQIYALHPDLIHRHSPRILRGAELICTHLESARAAYGLE